MRCIEVLVSSDSAFFEDNDYKNYFSDVDEFLQQFWGEESIIHQKTIHLDESTPHAHYLLSPIKNGKFHYSAYINGRDDLSNFQQSFEEFILAKGYDVERRDLSKNTQRKHKLTREWSKDMQKAKEYIELMDEKTLVDTAINGIMIESDVVRFRQRLQDTKNLEFSYKYYKDKAKLLEERIGFIMKEQGYSKEFIDYEIESYIKENNVDDKKMLNNETDIYGLLDKI